VTAVEVDPRYSGDCPQFSTLVKKTAESFDLRVFCFSRKWRNAMSEL
jgi:hypothetical protein